MNASTESRSRVNNPPKWVAPWHAAGATHTPSVRLCLLTKNRLYQ